MLSLCRADDINIMRTPTSKLCHCIRFRMANDGSTVVGHLQVTDEVTPSITLAQLSNAVPHTSQQYAFESLVLLIGLVGVSANGFVLVVMCISKQLKKNMVNTLIVNQVSSDLFSCVWIVIVYAV